MNATGWGLDDNNNNSSSKLGCVIFDSVDGLSNTLKRTSIRHVQDEMSTDSCGENIRYQAVEGLIHHDNRPKRQMSFLKQQVNIKTKLKARNRNFIYRILNQIITSSRQCTFTALCFAAKSLFKPRKFID